VADALPHADKPIRTRLGGMLRPEMWTERTFVRCWRGNNKIKR
jgi:hypothetical protein